MSLSTLSGRGFGGFSLHERSLGAGRFRAYREPCSCKSCRECLVRLRDEALRSALSHERQGCPHLADGYLNLSVTYENLLEAL